MSERLDVRARPRKDGGAVPLVVMVERPCSDAAARWARALELLLDAGLPSHDEDED